MSVKFEVGDNGKAQLEIGEFTTDAGREFISVRRLYKSGQDGKFYPQKNKKGGYNMIYLARDEWEELMPRMNQFLGIPNNQPQKEETQPEPKDDF